MIAYDRLSLIIPPDQALANKALQAALQQINGISISEFKDFSAAVTNLETTKGLPLVQAQTQALPDPVYQYYITTFASNYGTGPNGEITVADVLGAAAGIPYTEEYTTVVNNINNLTVNLQLINLTNIYVTMLNTVDGLYGSGPIMIPSGPAAGNYTDFDTAFAGNYPAPGLGLIPAAQAEINTIITNNPNIAASLNSATSIIAASIVRELANQSRAGIVWANLIANSQSSLMSFILGISTYGTATDQGGPTQMLENMADTSSLGGQSLIGALREARNVVELANANIETSTQVSAEPDTPAPQADLIDSTYSESQAKQQLIF